MKIAAIHKTPLARRPLAWLTGLTMLQIGGCSLTDLQLGLLDGVIQVMTFDVFAAAQTIFLNTFRV